MALDADELVFFIEERFGIKLSDDDLDSIQTVGEFHDLLLRKMGPNRHDDAHCGIVFYLLRQSLARAWNLKPDTLRPETKLHERIPRQDRRRGWDRLQEDLQLLLPELELPGWVASGQFMLSAALGASGWWWTGRALVGLIMWVMAAVLLTYLTRPLANRMPRSCLTLADLVYQVQSLNHPSERLELGPRGTWSILQGLIADLAMVPREQVQRSTRFAEDLHTVR